MSSSNFILSAIHRDLKTNRYKDIVLRFPPEPNGYLHLGHAKSIILNNSLARRFSGAVNLRFDDTNPAKESIEFVNSIITDSAWLGLHPDNIFYASDYFPIMLECAELLIRKSLAYVDKTKAEDYKNLKGGYGVADTETVYRTNSVAENLSLFKSMCSGEFAPGSAVLRAKIDLGHANMTLRDPVLYRVSDTHHYRHANNYKVYPMYDFAHPIEDAIEKISHSLCTLEFENNRPLYDWVIDNCVEVLNHKPRQIEFARLNLSDVALSKRHLAKLVENPLISAGGGWSHPVMPTISGLRTRGFTPGDIEAYIEELGVSKENSTTSFAKLESKLVKKEKVKLLGFIDKVRIVVLDTNDTSLDKIVETFNHGYNVNKNIVIDKKDLKIFNDASVGVSSVGEVFRLNHLANLKVERLDLDNLTVYVSIIHEELTTLPALKLSWGLDDFREYKVYPSTRALASDNIEESLKSSRVYLPSYATDLPASSVVEIPRLGVLLKNTLGGFSWVSRVGEK